MEVRCAPFFHCVPNSVKLGDSTGSIMDDGGDSHVTFMGFDAGIGDYWTSVDVGRWTF